MASLDSHGVLDRVAVTKPGWRIGRVADGLNAGGAATASGRNA